VVVLLSGGRMAAQTPGFPLRGPANSCTYGVQEFLKLSFPLIFFFSPSRRFLLRVLREAGLPRPHGEAEQEVCLCS